jgi:hypothetical protein
MDFDRRLGGQLGVAPIGGPLQLFQVIAPGDLLAVDVVRRLGLGGYFRDSRKRLRFNQYDLFRVAGHDGSSKIIYYVEKGIRNWGLGIIFSYK